MVCLACAIDPYPTAIELVLVFSLLLIPTEVLRQPNVCFVFLTSGMFVPLIVCPTMSVLWIDRNAGNANYMFVMVLGLNSFLLALLSSWFVACKSILKRGKRLSFCHDVLNSVL